MEIKQTVQNVIPKLILALLFLVSLACETIATIPTSTPIPTQTPIPEFSFAEIIQNPNEKGWTSTQYSTYFETIKGKNINEWSGTILEIKEWGGEPYLSLDIKSGEPEIDAYVYINKDDVLKVGLGQNVTFSGVIDDNWAEANGYYALQIKDVKLINLGEILSPVLQPTVTLTKQIDTLVDVHSILGKPVNEVENVLGISSLIVANDDNDDNLAGGEYRDYQVNRYTATIAYDETGIARVFQINFGLLDENYALEDWNIVLPKFGIQISTPPDREAPQAIYWDNYNGYFIAVAGRPIYTVQIAEFEYHP